MGASLLSSMVLIGGALLFLTMSSWAGSNETGFALKDKDTVVFLGDSITAARGYTKIDELYTLMGHPELRVRFWNAGKCAFRISDSRWDGTYGSRRDFQTFCIRFLGAPFL